MEIYQDIRDLLFSYRKLCLLYEKLPAGCAAARAEQKLREAHFCSRHASGEDGQRQSPQSAYMSFHRKFRIIEFSLDDNLFLLCYTKTNVTDSERYYKMHFRTVWECYIYPIRTDKG